MLKLSVRARDYLPEKKETGEAIKRQGRKNHAARR
jgi:hypothetical protein